MEGACGSVEDCWKGLRIGSTPKHLVKIDSFRGNGI